MRAVARTGRPCASTSRPTLYGVGNRLDDTPELLFRLRGVDPAELISAETVLPDGAADGADALAEDQLGDIFGIDLEADDQ